MSVLIALSLLACRNEPAEGDDTGAVGCDETWWPDDDADGHGRAGAGINTCTPADGWVDQGGDCDDTDATVNPDGVEVCDGIDQNCDDVVDEGVTVDAYDDADLDGFGDPLTQDAVCEVPADRVDNGDDCNDTDPEIHPDATELCNLIDDDCNGLVDDAEDAQEYYVDADRDGYGGDEIQWSCEDLDGLVLVTGDCDDLDASSYPGAPEVCDDADNNCDGEIDEEGATGGDTFWADTDSDGFGDPASTTESCDLPEGYADNDDDCDDTLTDVNPDADELCDGVNDDDCDGVVDEDDAVDASTWYVDADSDTFGNASYSTESCTQPAGYADNGDDCDDGDANSNPDADEVCGGADEDCDGTTDESGAVDASTWYIDSDVDGYGDSATTTVSCDAPSGYASVDGDCDDTDDTVNPGATEVCDGVDNDCDSDVDQGAVWVGTDYTTIQDALDDAADGDLICVAAATYYETLDFNGVDAILEGESGGTVAVDGGGSGPIVTANSLEEIELRNLTLQNGSATYGPGLYLYRADAVLQDVTFDTLDCASSSACYGGAVYIYSGTLEGEGLTFTAIDSSGSTTTYGGAIYASSADTELSDVDADTVDCASSACLGGFQYSYYGDHSVDGLAADSMTADVSSYVNGALYYGQYAELTANDVEVTNGTYGGDSTGMFHNYYGAQTLSDVSITDNSFSPYDAFYGLVAYDWYYYASAAADGIDVDGLVVTGNDITFSSGAGYLYGGLMAYTYGYYYGTTGTWDNVEVVGNTITDVSVNYGAALYAQNYYENLLTNVILAGNDIAYSSSTSYHYGWFYTYADADLVVTNADLYANTTDTATYMYGGVFVAGYYGDMEIRNTNVVNNTAVGSTEYGAVYYNAYAYTNGYAGTLTWDYSNSYGNTPTTDDLYWSGGTTRVPSGTYWNVDPSYSDVTSSTATDWDLTLGSGSSLIDAGDPSLSDIDGSTSDVGAYGGPGAAL
jgi:hypothetical protein